MSHVTNSPSKQPQPDLPAAAAAAAAQNVADKNKSPGPTPPAIAQTSIPQKWPVASKKSVGKQ